MDDRPELTALHQLSDPPAATEVVGGKGAQLMRLTAAGLPVPLGFVVPIGVDLTRQAAAIGQAYRDLGSPPVAVRSSAPAEDAAAASYAGQFESFLDVRGETEVLDAIERCRASGAAARVAAYRDRIGDAASGVAVVVQTMVPADAAGVLFTRDPVSGDEAVVINAGTGLGEALVGGDVTPEVWRVDSDEVRGPDSAVLSVTQARRLAALARAIEALLGGPVDVEWCRVGEDFSVVQARPLTSAAPRPLDGPDPWNDSQAGDFLWTSTNAGEAIPDVMTPATWSMVQVFMHDAMATASVPPFIGYGRIGGRAYLNVSVMQALAGAFGVPEWLFRRLTAQVFGRIPPDVKIPAVPAKRWAILRGVGPLALHVIKEARREVRAGLDDYLAGHPERCATRLADIAGTATPAALAELWRTTLEPEFHRASLMLSAATRSSGLSFVLTGPWLERLAGPAVANALTAGLGGESGLASLGLIRGLEQVARGELTRDDFNWRYGHRGPHEFEISLPRPGEDPAWVDAQLASHRTGAAARLDGLEVERAAAWSRLAARHPGQARILRFQVRRWAAISRRRELARSEVIRYFWVLRAYALRAGALTGLGDDVFYLYGPEIQRVLRGETIGSATLAARRAAYAGYSRLPPYPVLIRGSFDPYAWAADPTRRSDLAGAAGEAAADVTGFPGSAGVVTGRVRVLTDMGQGADLADGEVLVTRATNVGWTPLFPRCAAVVTDIGAPLSHAAIVARELGVPAVVGCGNATMRLRTGDLVRVDGAAGTVTRLG